MPHLAFAISDLRNAVAHNGVVFDAITDCLVLVVYLSVGLGFPKREVYRATTSYASLTDELRSRVPARAFDRIAHTDNRAKVRRPEAWVRAT